MEKLLTTYLFEHKNCPLPEVGTLLLQPGHAVFLPGEKRMIAPIPFIELSEKEISADALLDFVAAQKGISTTEVSFLLKKYCEGLQQLPAYGEIPMGELGSFYMDENGKLHFKSVSLPAAFFPDVVAERVIHPDVAHEILVGDTHTN
ncbi:MAG: hypothetical protein H7X88_06665, partial [Gloeobacteraceae cyanobacterium ES-bin-316]|nr:hypothetical protein [Ferruginibacter sp.]